MASDTDEKKRSVKSLFHTLKDIFALSKPYRVRFYLATVAVLVASAIWLTVPLGLRELIDAVFEVGNRSLLNWLAIGLFVLFVMQSLFSFLGNYHLEWVGERVITDLRKKCTSTFTNWGSGFTKTEDWEKLRHDSPTMSGSIRTALTDSLPQLLPLPFR